MRNEWKLSGVETDRMSGSMLEHLVDRHGMSMVIDALSLIASAKAEHIDANWQQRRHIDETDPQAELWRQVHTQLSLLAGDFSHEAALAPTDKPIAVS